LKEAERLHPKGQYTLMSQVAAQEVYGWKMWPTPCARDWKDTPGMARSSTNADGSTRKRTDQLARRVYAEEDTPKGGGYLNPTWVEWLMGFPLGWTEPDASGTP
jgi:DNA (cytosine-5)-methyltransferase 1